MVKGNFCPFKKQTKCCSANYRTTCETSAFHWWILKPTSSIGHSLNCFDAPSFHDSFRFFRHSFILFYQIETSQRVQYRNHHVIIQNKEKASLRQINKQLWKDYKKKHINISSLAWTGNRKRLHCWLCPSCEEYHCR